jgi:hypothetical protein
MFFVHLDCTVDDGKTKVRAPGPQMSASPNGSVVNTLKLIFRGEGVPGLYRGVMPNMFTAGMGWGLYFYA